MQGTAWYTCRCWTLNHSNSIQLWILIMIRYLTQDKNLTRTKVVTFWLLLPKWFQLKLPKINPNLAFGIWHLVVQCQSDFYLNYYQEIRKKKYWFLASMWPFIHKSQPKKINPSLPFVICNLANSQRDPFTFTQVFLSGHRENACFCPYPLHGP